MREEAWSDDGPAFWAMTKVLLDRVMGHERVIRSTSDGYEDNLPDAFRTRDVYKWIEGSAGI